MKTVEKKYRDIKDVREIKIGDVLIYVGEETPWRLMYDEWQMKTEDDLIQASIQIIERGHKWRPKA